MAHRVSHQSTLILALLAFRQTHLLTNFIFPIDQRKIMEKKDKGKTLKTKNEEELKPQS